MTETTFVIRSMSTTNSNFEPAYRDALGNLVPAQKPEPYHCYLMPVAKRRSAYWSRSQIAAMVFQTAADAQAEIDRCELTRCDIAPVDHGRTGFPAYWDRRLS